MHSSRAPGTVVSNAIQSSKMAINTSPLAICMSPAPHPPKTPVPEPSPHQRRPWDKWRTPRGSSPQWASAASQTTPYQKARDKGCSLAPFWEDKALFTQLALWFGGIPMLRGGGGAFQDRWAHSLQAPREAPLRPVTRRPPITVELKTTRQRGRRAGT